MLPKCRKLWIDLGKTVETECPKESLDSAIALHVRDWGAHRRDAWIYGIVCGWYDALDEVGDQHGWDDEAKARLKRLHEAFKKLKK